MQFTTRIVDDDPYGKGQQIARAKKKHDKEFFRAYFRSLPDYETLRLQHDRRVAAMRVQVQEMRAARAARELANSSATRIQMLFLSKQVRRRVRLRKAAAAKAAYRLKHNDYFVKLARSKMWNFVMPSISSFPSFK